MTEAQQYELGAYVNLMSSSTQLLVNPILGLQPKYNEEDLNEFLSWEGRKTDSQLCIEHKELLISLSNFLYRIELDERDRKLLLKTLRGNKEMLKSINMKKKEFDDSIIEAVNEALTYSCGIN